VCYCGLKNVFEDVVKGFGDVPGGVVSLHFGEVADVADVVTLAILVDVFPAHGFAGKGGDFFEGFEDGDAIGAATADVVDLAAAGVFKEGVHEADDIQAVDVVADLLALVAEDIVLAFGEVAFDEVTEEAVELDAAVVGAGEAAAAEGAGFQAKVAAIFLNQNIGSDFGGTEEAMLALVDGEVFGYAVDEGEVGVVPAGGKFLKGDGVGAVTVDFVGAHVDEHSVRHMEAGGFEHVKRADGIGIEVVEGTGSSEIVTGLGGRVDDSVWLERGEARKYGLTVADVELVMLEPRVLGLETLLVPTGIALGAEEVSAHVVVHAVDCPTEVGEVVDDFGANEAGGTGDEEGGHRSGKWGVVSGESGNFER
jgi:hypothetical protein